MYLALKLVHILSSTVLFGTGLGTAFSMWRANASRDPRLIASVARSVAIADWIFTTPAVVVQPITGIALARLAGFPLTSNWLVLSIALYFFIGACWIPVVWLQLRMRDLAQAAANERASLPPRYSRYYRAWFALGWPAFTGVIGIFTLMVFKPSL
jgi:uncharacterized membrane protein